MERRSPHSSDSLGELVRRALEIDSSFEPLLALTRGSAVESLHRGAVAVVDSRGDLVGGVGDPSVVVHLRSAAKPFQALAVVETGATDTFSISDEELAVMCGSHSGQLVHTQIVGGLLQRLGVSPSSLVCGSLEHMCSGKHAGLIALALHLGAPLEGYEREDHPAQVQVARTLNTLLSRRPGHPARRWREDGDVTACSMFSGLDGCGVPVVRVSLYQAAWLYALLSAGATPSLARVRDAMLAHPDLVAGEGCFDTRAMSLATGRLLAKRGAEGLQGLSVRLGDQCDSSALGALGCVIKVEDGSSRALPSLVALFLEAYGFEELALSLERAYPLSVLGVGETKTGELIRLISSHDLRRTYVAGRATRVSADQDYWRIHGMRLATARADDKEVSRFLREEWPWADEETFGRPVEWIAEPLVFVLRRKRKILAVLKGHFVGGVGSVDELIVRRGERGLGAGSLMLRQFEKEARRRDCTRVVLRAVKNSSAEDFYRSRGYYRESVQCSYEFGYDYVRLTRHLEGAEWEPLESNGDSEQGECGR